MKNFLPVMAAVLILLINPLSGCLEKSSGSEQLIARTFWAEIYEPEVNISDIGSGGIPEVGIHYSKVGEGKEKAGIGDQIFLCYGVYTRNMNAFDGKAYCKVDGKLLSPFDTDHEYLPTSYEESLQVGLPPLLGNEAEISPEEVHTFKWPYRFSSYGNHTAEFYLKDINGTIYGRIERNFSIDYVNQNDSRWGFIITVDPPGDEVASWKDGAMVFDMLSRRYGFPRQNIIYLSNGCATRDNVLNAMKWVSQHTDAGSKIVFWASGHGGLELNGDDDREIIDGKIELWDGNLYDGDVADFFADSNSMNILSVVDTCFSGEFGGPDDLESVFAHFGSGNKMEEEGRVLITSSTTITRAKATDNGGLLTIFMVAALEGIKDRMGNTADSNDDGKISAEEAGFWAVLHCYARHSFPELNDCYIGDLYLEK